ncbi:hypothetical protein L2E82_09199 [Cichorium intybus]|uniref:Uncharacterized protein n=1 Tax=Cichorium intybus TaxID=13427 RepID=A0ACB9G8U0_CICIN|nr:hypothetical protein L2E82_09199 [Cichorium intybus]
MVNLDITTEDFVIEIDEDVQQLHTRRTVDLDPTITSLESTKQFLVSSTPTFKAPITSTPLTSEDNIKLVVRNVLEKVELKCKGLEKSFDENIKEKSNHVDAKIDDVELHSILPIPKSVLSYWNLQHPSMNYIKIFRSLSSRVSKLQKQLNDAKEKIKELELKAQAHDIQQMAQTTMKTQTEQLAAKTIVNRCLEIHHLLTMVSRLPGSPKSSMSLSQGGGERFSATMN